MSSLSANIIDCDTVAVVSSIASDVAVKLAIYCVRPTAMNGMRIVAVLCCIVKLLLHLAIGNETNKLGEGTIVFERV